MDWNVLFTIRERVVALKLLSFLFQCIKDMGNTKARRLYEANLPDSFRRPQTDQYPLLIAVCLNEINTVYINTFPVLYLFFSLTLASERWNYLSGTSMRRRNITATVWQMGTVYVQTHLKWINSNPISLFLTHSDVHFKYARNALYKLLLWTVQGSSPYLQPPLLWHQQSPHPLSWHPHSFNQSSLGASSSHLALQLLLCIFCLIYLPSLLCTRPSTLILPF